MMQLHFLLRRNYFFFGFGFDKQLSQELALTSNQGCVDCRMR